MLPSGLILLVNVYYAGTDLTIFSPRASGMGHHIGDESVSVEWSQICNDLIARVVGLFPETFIGVAHAAGLTDERGQRVPLHISVGLVARVPQAGEPVHALIAEADAALYGAKGAGRNQVRLAA